MRTPIRGAAFAALSILVAGCSHMPPPAEPVQAPPIFAVSGDTSEVLSTLPAPVIHGRPSRATSVEEPDTAGAASAPGDSPVTPAPPRASPDAAPAPRPAQPPASPAAPRNPAPPPATRQAAADWLVQVFASTERAKAYAEAQRAERLLGLGDEELSLDSREGLYRVRVGAPSRREDALALLARARRFYPKAFVVPAGPQVPR